MQTCPDNWTIKDCIEFLQRKIILNSVLYYEYDMSPLSDAYYDSICKSLVSYQHIFARHSDILTGTRFGYIYYDFDGTTGFHLAGRLNIQDKIQIDKSIEVYLSRNRGYE